MAYVCKVGGEDKTLYLVPLAMKGDWPALVKCGELKRHHLRDVSTKSSGAGICHLCLGGQESIEWHDDSYNNMKRMRIDCPPPWSNEPHLLRHLPVGEPYKHFFFRIDLFHTLHKGVFGDIAANAIATWHFYRVTFTLKLVDLFFWSHYCSLFPHLPQCLDQDAAHVSICDYVHDDMGIEAALNAIFLDIQKYCKRNSLQLHMQGLTRTLVGYANTSQYPTGLLGVFLKSWILVFIHPKKTMVYPFGFLFLSELKVYSSWGVGTKGQTQHLCSFTWKIASEERWLR